MPLLLDTEVLIWWDANDKRLGEKARTLIRDAEAVYVSAASAWEISIKVALGKLRTSRLPSAAVADSDFRTLPVTFEHAEAVLALPAHHRDPFDRLIVAAAQVERLAVVSSDSQIAHVRCPADRRSSLTPHSAFGSGVERRTAAGVISRPCPLIPRRVCLPGPGEVHCWFAEGLALGSAREWVSRTAARTLCNFSLRTASGPEGSSAK